MEKLRKFLAGLSVTALLTSVIGFGAIASAATFSDVPSDHWAYSQVEDLASQGVVEGLSDGSFGCAATANRAEFSKMVALAFGFDSSTDYDAGFSDVPSDAWYAGYVNVLAQNGVVGGYTDADGNSTGLFGPGDNVNRAAAAKMLVAAAGLETASGGNYFSDVTSGAWYYDAVETLYANSVVDGYGDGRFGPADDLQRCALAKMVVGAQNPVLRDMGDDTTGDDTTGDDTVVVSTGALSVMAGDVIAGAAVPKAANGVSMLNFKVSASSDDVRLNEVVVHRFGVGASTDFSNVYLYEGDNRLTTGRTISSETNTVTFSALRLDIPAGTTKTLTVKADFSTSANASNTDGFEILSADAFTHNGATTGGTFPLKGNEFTVSGATAGTVTITKNGNTANVTVGQQAAEIAKFQLAASGESVRLSSVALRVRGSISSSLLTNMKLWQNGTELASVEGVNSKDLMVFVLASPLRIEKSNDLKFSVSADIGAGDPNDTVLVDLDENTDLVAVGEVYGFGAQIDSDNSNGYAGTAGSSPSSCTGWDDASCSVVQGGQFTVSFNGPPASDVAINGRQVVLARYALTSEVDAEVRKLSASLVASSLTASPSGSGGLWDTGTSTANYTNIKLVDEDTGETVGSPQDTTSSSVTSQTFNYTDIFSIDAGETRNLKLIADIANNALMANSVVTATLSAISTSEGVRDLSTGNYITDIVPASAVASNPMTVKAPSLAIALATPATAKTIVKGTTGFDAVSFAVTAGNASDVKMTDVTLSCYMDNVATTSGVFALAAEGGVKCSDTVTSVTLYDGDGNQVSSGSKTFNATTGVATFTGVNWTIPAGQTKRLVPRVNIGNSAVPNGSSDAFKIDIADVSADITVQDADGNSITPSGSDYPNGSATTATRAITVTTSGTITVASSYNPVRDDKLVAGVDSAANPTLVSRFKVYAVNEAFQVTEMAFMNDSAANNSLENNGLVQTVYLKYPTSASAPSTLDGTATAILNSSGQALFTGLAMMVPQSDSDENAVEVEVYVTTNSITTGTTGGQVEMDFKYNTGFKAVGQGSGATVTQADSGSAFGTVADVDANQMAFYKSLPTFAKDNSSAAPCPTNKVVASTSADVYCFTITASSGGNIAVHQLAFDATPNLIDTGDLSGAAGFTIFKYQSNGSVIATQLGSGTWANNKVNVTFVTPETVTKSTSSYYVLRAPITFNNSTDSSSLSVRLATDGASAHAASTGASVVVAANAVTTVWSDMSASPHTVSSADWANSYKLENLPSSYLQLSE